MAVNAIRLTCMQNRGYNPEGEGRNPEGEGHNPEGEGRNPEGEGRNPEGEGCIMYKPCSTQLPCYMCYVSQGWGTCALLGSNRRHVLSTHILALQDDELHSCVTCPWGSEEQDSLLSANAPTV